MVLDIIGRKKMTIEQICSDFYFDNTETLDPNNYVASIIRRISRKCAFNKLDWTLTGKGSGRHGKTVWRTKRPSIASRDKG